MGDSCFNEGMKSLTEASGKYLGVYSVCIPTGDTRVEDTLNGFFQSMDANIDVFAQKVKNDPALAGGFNCVGLSQGNNICRGYIERYNSPLAASHLSVHGPVVGVASLPNCEPDAPRRGSLCVTISDLLAKAAYLPKVQDFLFQVSAKQEKTFPFLLPFLSLSPSLLHSFSMASLTFSLFPSFPLSLFPSFPLSLFLFSPPSHSG